MNALLERWQAWTVRERRLVLAAGLSALVAILYLAFIDPAIEGRRRLARELPRLRADASTMAAIAASAASLPKPPAPGAGELRPALESSLQAAGLKATVGTGAGANNSATVKFDKVAYTLAAGWLSRIVHDMGVHVESANVISQGEGGRVNAEFVLAR